MAAGSVAPGRLNRGADALCRATGSAVVATVPLTLLWCIALALVARRLAGALVQPLAPGMLLAGGVVVLGASLAIRRLVAKSSLRRLPADLMNILSTLALVLMAWSVSLPGSSLTALGLLWAAAIAPAIASQLASYVPISAVLRRVDDRAGHLPRSAPVSSPSVATHQALPLENSLADTGDEESIEPEPLDESDEFDPRILQRLTRLRDDDGSDAIEGWCRVMLAAGQRQATSHLAFCPPLDHVPTIDVEQLDGPAARIKVGQSLSQGARLELKLAEAQPESSQVLLRFRAS